MTRHVRIRGVGRFLSPRGEDFVSVEALSGIVLLLAAAAALMWANLATNSYDSLVEYQHWINDGLMTVFFFVVGLEIKRELIGGELADRRAAIVPIVAAVGGMVVPACIYLAINAGTDAVDGWIIQLSGYVLVRCFLEVYVKQAIEVDNRQWSTSIGVVCKDRDCRI